MSKTEAAQGAIDKEVVREYWITHRAALALGLAMETRSSMGVIITQISTQSPAVTGKDFRAIIKCEDEQGRKWVAFRNAGTLKALQEGLAAEILTDGLKLREDVPYGEPKPDPKDVRSAPSGSWG